MIRAIVFDLDDTLLRDDRTISDHTVSVLRRAAGLGIHIIPASGRVRDSMLPFVQQIGCASLFIAGNGAEVYAPDATPLMTRHIAPDLARQVARFAAEHDCYAQAYEGRQFFYAKDGRHAAAYAASSLLEGVKVPDLAQYIHKPTPKILMIDDPARIAQLLEKSRQRFGDVLAVTCSKPIYLEITPPEATKGNALKWAAEHLGFALDEVMAFGDSLNDMSMLAVAGHGVAMGNAREDVKARLKYQCLSNQEDGVARYIEEHILQEVSA